MEQTMMKAQKSVSILVFTLFIRLKKLLYIVTFQLAKQGNDKEILLVALIRTPKEKKEKKHSTSFVITNQQQHVPC
jgi:hypothetical protein